MKFDVLNHGYVELVDHMGDDAAICAAARVSYGAGTRSVSDDTTLIRYMLRHGHTSPFEMCEVKLCVQVPMDVWRQWIRHRTANVNEYSTRYSEAIDLKNQTEPTQWRLQNPDNKQGSSGYCDLSLGYMLTDDEFELHEAIDRIYQKRLDAGVAREQARKDLPLSTYTRAIWKNDLHNLMNFLYQRMNSHAQLEIRSYANVIGQQIIAKLFPITWAAFCDYQLNAMRLSAPEIDIINRYGLNMSNFTFEHATVNWNRRERNEFKTKLNMLGWNGG